MPTRPTFVHPRRLPGLMHSVRQAQLALLLGVLVFALVLAPALGQLHRVLHMGAGHSQGAAVAVATAAVDHAHAHGGLADLFGDHATGGDCRLYDQLGHGDLGCGVPTLALPVLLPSAFVLAWREGQALARRAALFQARAPPAFR